MIQVPPTTSWADLDQEQHEFLLGIGERAKGLLGGRLSVTRDDETVVALISEVEAYGGPLDPAAHSYRGPSPRNAATFGPPWHAYVYRHMGLHTCFNVVVGEVGDPSCVLVRAATVVDGLDVARRRRSERGRTRHDWDLAAGPARLTVALGITIADGGTPLDGSTGLRLDLDPAMAPAISEGPRIGVGKAVDYPLRYWLTGEESVSVPR